MAEVLEIESCLQADIRVARQLSHVNEKTPSSDGANEPSNQVEDLPRVADRIPVSAWLVILISTFERFAFFGIREPFRECRRYVIFKVKAIDLGAENYLQNQRDDPLRPGALGLGQSKASNLSYMFSFLLYTMPLFASVIIDCFLGRYRGILVFLWSGHVMTE
jgi:POT family proton-dependent oligopeptide transporter